MEPTPKDTPFRSLANDQLSESLEEYYRARETARNALRALRTHRLNVRLVDKGWRYESDGHALHAFHDVSLERIKPEGWIAPLP